MNNSQHTTMDDNTMQFIKSYPKKGYIQPENVQWNSNQHLDVLYSSAYRQLLKLYHTSDENAKLIKEHILDKIENKVLVDLGCGNYNANVSALAYQSNAKAYIGIDVNVDMTEYDDKILKGYLIEQYKLSEHIRLHSTMIRTVFDNFENFLKKAPDKAGHNFTINGLELTNSKNSMREHLERIMIPGNIILANTTENIDISDIIVGPHKHTKIQRIYGFDSLHVYEKLDGKIKKTQEEIIVTLER